MRSHRSAVAAVQLSLSRPAPGPLRPATAHLPADDHLPMDDRGQIAINYFPETGVSQSVVL
jgi:hypothetical protein